MKRFKGTDVPWGVELNYPEFTVRISNSTKHEMKYNLRLIEQSPSLLSSLQHLVEVYDSDDGKQWTTASKKAAIAEARAAIDKALGE